MKTMLLFILLALMVGCADSGGGGSVSSKPLSGSQRDGTWKASGIECFNSGYASFTNGATFQTGYTDTIVISGNSFTQTFQEGSCTVVVSGNIEFKSGDKVDITNATVASATGNSCNIIRTLSNGSIAPNNSTTSYTAGQLISGATDSQYLDGGESNFELLSTYDDGQGGACHISYMKQ